MTAEEAAVLKAAREFTKEAQQLMAEWGGAAVLHAPKGFIDLYYAVRRMEEAGG